MNLPSQTNEELVAELVALMQLEELDTNLYRGPRTKEYWRRVFGGQVISQALMAATHTVDITRPAHSLHAYFMRPGNPDLPIIYEVFRDRDGSSFSSRRVVALQAGKPILNLSASFALRETGLSHQFPMPDVPMPETLLSQADLARSDPEYFTPERFANITRPRPLEFRPIMQDVRYNEIPREPFQSAWFRASAPLPDDNILHRALLAYASDMMLLYTSVLPHGVKHYSTRLQEASLDHALWIHDDFRLDDWLLYVLDAPWSGGARGLNRGLVYTKAGKLVASVTQEGLIRVREV